ncbi:hypothetical protein [Herpetosiphon geysericola]|uniref:Uncharacterized protein n=1 Tax=Herpetosiphon geysericola TaxID=70996 RepID=A0A0N8GSV7_9CHLR|nr:hypothetical protein [Herpetosiphon geysericola]KPL90370.1 hypothetical protein SE18_07105 [Herpetosiphon geysericola]
MEKHYDRRALLQAYIATQTPYGHEDIRRFNARRLAVLEQAFDLTISEAGINNKANRQLWRLFSATIDSYRSSRTPGSDFMDSSLIMQQLDTLGTQAAALCSHWKAIDSAAAASKHSHLAMLDELFKLLWGNITLVVTSQQLKQRGFDDTQEPNWLDYE